MAQNNRAARERLLLVDDNPTNLQVLFQALEAEGYELLVAQSGEEAIETARQARPQLILLDINMPGLDGYETCRRLKADDQTRDCVVVFLSARGDVADKVLGLEVGAVDYIGKPFQFEEVLARVRKHLDTYRQQEELRRQNVQLQARLAGDFQDLSDEQLRGLIAQGESQVVEFKSTLRVNLHTGKPDKRIENACLKTVAAYLNTDGGMLFVGVDDSGTALGLDQDLFPNEDRLLLHWNGLIKTCLGVEFTRFVRSNMRDLDGKRILLVQCTPSPQPVFLRRDNDELFCVRTGNGSQPLRPSEILAYLEQRSAQGDLIRISPALKGRQLGQYTIDEKLGSGGVGVVYRAHHAMLRRPAAVKILDESKTNERTLARFEREVQLASQLNHPNTIAIYDYGRTSEGVFYYVMEYLDGIDLEELVRHHGALAEARVIHILRQVCGSLAEAHGAGLIHRDVKPANIMLNRRGGLHDVVKLLDFGLVKALDAENETRLTAVGAVAGTPKYISPEGVISPEDVDIRSDLYSLGAVGYYLIAGSPVFTGHSAINICKQHARSQPKPPSDKRGEPIADDLERIVLRCLAKNPDERPQSARELADELSSCRHAGTWTEEAARAWWDENLG
jgi:CheY-like chemotaxis protein